MSVESASYINQLNESNPTSSDLKSEGDNHIRLLKSTLKTTFPNVTGAVTPTHTQLNFVTGVTSAIQDQINRTIRQSGGSAVNALPDAATRALKVLSFDSSGHPRTTILETDLAAAVTAAANAATSASNAATSETNAAASASTASTQASNAATQATNAASSATSAASTYDAFDDRYLGSKSSNPTLDNDGNALLTGAIYWNTVTPEMRVYTGSAWVSVSNTATSDAAAASASAAATSASNASTSASTASTQATNAATSASNAANSASSASTQATNASNSATAAASSAGAASTSATAASNSETSAASQATNAANSASAAASSASSASTSASTATTQATNAATSASNAAAAYATIASNYLTLDFSGDFGLITDTADSTTDYGVLA